MTGWPASSRAATIYVDELPFHHHELPGSCPSIVMAQIESDAALAKIGLTAATSLSCSYETGLRARRRLQPWLFNPVVRRQRRLALPALLRRPRSAPNSSSRFRAKAAAAIMPSRTSW